MARQAIPRLQPVRVLRTGAVPALLASLLFLPPASADEAQDLKAAIVMRCYHAVGEFGAELVDRCVQEDAAAEQALKQYPAEAKPLIQSCTDRLIGNGFGRIKACVDEKAVRDPGTPSGRRE